MMVRKPNQVDHRSKFVGTIGIGHPSPRGLSSPRLHFAGEIPPELSPLDAFAAQSRLLARQLEECSHGEHRMSRLPPLTIASSLSPARPNYYRSSSAGPSPPLTSEKRTQVEAMNLRHASIHPTVSSTNDDENPTSPVSLEHTYLPYENPARDRRPQSSQGDYVSQQNNSSPTKEICQSSLRIEHQASVESLSRRPHLPPGGPNGSVTSRQTKSLLPPRSKLEQRSPSPRSPCTDSSDDDLSTSNTQPAPFDRKYSGDEYWSHPISPSENSLGRTSSISSDASFCATRIMRSPAFNFSRPLSRTSVNPDLPSRHTSSDSASCITPDDAVDHASVNLYKPEVGITPTYVYSKFALPRGKLLQRNSAIFLGTTASTPIPLESPGLKSAPPSPPFKPSTSPLRQKQSFAESPPSLGVPEPPSNSSAVSLLSPNCGKLSPEKTSSNRTKSPSLQRPTTSSMESTTTVKARSHHSLASAADCSANEHVEKAIGYHNAGELNKSTYHLRLAARMSHPTGMLLYALACRHGWGMRPNPREGVAWLRKAVDEAGLEVADGENMLKSGKKVDFTETKVRKAQFALSIYELGVSHMNGWGIEQDKALALRCFEIAGSWGDADAMAEAGFCYAQGVGCKKDLKKSAKFYRMAEAHGINMIGNSWIYKSKYDDDSPAHKEADGRGRSNTTSSKSTTASADKRHKSRTRGIFGRSKILVHN